VTLYRRAGLSIALATLLSEIAARHASHFAAGCLGPEIN